MTTLAAQLNERFTRQSLIGKTLSQCVTLAQSIGQLAEVGKQLGVKESRVGVVVGSIQAGEYILTGKVPDKALVRSVLKAEAIQ
jgi:hypothetical protein